MNSFLNFDQTRYIVYCMSCVCQLLNKRIYDDDDVHIAALLRVSLAGLICIVHPTGCISGCKV